MPIETKRIKTILERVEKEVAAWECKHCHKIYDTSTGAWNCESNCECTHEDVCFIFSDDGDDGEAFDCSLTDAENLVIETKCKFCEKIIKRDEVPISKLIELDVIK